MSIRPTSTAPSGHPYDDVRPEVAVFDVDGVAVELVRVPIHRDPITDLSYSAKRYGKDGSIVLGHPCEQRRYEVRVDGAFVGYAVRPYGGGRQSYRCVALFSGYEPGLGRHGHPELDGGPAYQLENYELVDVARAFAGWRKSRTALTFDEMKRVKARRHAEERRREKDLKERMAADRRRDQAEAIRRRDDRNEMLAGLREIVDQHRGSLSNFQMDALGRAIARIETESPSHYDQILLKEIDGP